jgi:crotonobetainyl-CoA:carnitine CoA-transferase CaiB-like acyl-CoA transferase
MVETGHPVAGPLTMPGLPYRWEDAAPPAPAPAPRLGQDNAAVYRALGLMAAEVARLEAAGVLR